MKAWLLLTCLLPGVASADVQAVRYPNGSLEIQITDHIRDTDTCRLAEIIVQTPYTTPISIDSKGGSVIAGINMGRIIGWSQRTVLVRRDAVAYSAAADIVLGARRRAIAGDVGFHAPYMDHQMVGDPQMVALAIKRQVDGFMKFLMDAGLSPGSIDRIMATGPKSIIRLNSNELTAVPGITGDAAVIRDVVAECHNMY